MQRNKKIILAVTNNLISDQRLNKVCQSLFNQGFKVCLVGAKFQRSARLEARDYQTFRLFLFFRKGPLFYAEYNLKLFFYLLFSKANVFVANDLDTLLPVYLASAFRQKKLVYDSHEYFTEVPELIGRKVRKIWLKIEQFILPRVKNSYTVCQSIANEYQRLYGIEMKVVRNFPTKEIIDSQIEIPHYLKDKKIILYQGALNVGRGVEYVIRAMQLIEDAVFLIIGDGDIRKELMQEVEDLNLQSKVIFIGKVPFNQLLEYTKLAQVGISLFEDRGLSYRFSLPNRLFDYIKAQIPVLISNLPEMQSIMNKYEIGISIEGFDNDQIVWALNEMLTNLPKRKLWQQNLEKAALEYNWENEESELFKIYLNLL